MYEDVRKVIDREARNVMNGEEGVSWMGR